MLHALIADAQARLDRARRELKAAVQDFDISDEALMEMRASARKTYEELAELDKKLLRKGIFGLLKFW